MMTNMIPAQPWSSCSHPKERPGHVGVGAAGGRGKVRRLLDNNDNNNNNYNNNNNSNNNHDLNLDFDQNNNHDWGDMMMMAIFITYITNFITIVIKILRK